MGVVEEYRRFQFMKSPKFRLFVGRLDSKIIAHSQELVKRLFYKYFIYESFDLNFDGNFADFTDKHLKRYLANSKKQTKSIANLQTQQSAPASTSSRMWYLFPIESYLKLFFIIGTSLIILPLRGSLPMLNALYIIALLASFIATIRKYFIKSSSILKAIKKSSKSQKANNTKSLQQSQQQPAGTSKPESKMSFQFSYINYLEPLLQFQDARQFLYLIVFLFYESQRGMLLFLLPLACTFIIDVANYQMVRETVIHFVFEKQFNFIIRKRSSILSVASSLQVFFTLVLAQQAFFGKGSFFLFIIYLQYLKTVSQSSTPMKRIISMINAKTIKFVQVKYIPPFIPRLYLAFVVLMTGTLPKQLNSKQEVLNTPITTYPKKQKTE